MERFIGLLRVAGRTVPALAIGVATLAGAQTAAADEPIKVKIGWQPAVEAAFFVAREDGLFEENGLDPEYLRFNAGPPEFAALSTGDIDIGYMGGPPAVIALAQGIPVKVFYVESDESDSERLVVRADADIGSLEDLKGATVGVWRGTSAEFALRRALDSVGLDFDDVNVLDLDATAMVPAFEKGDVDAVHVWDPWALKLEELGGKALVRDSDVGVRMPDPWLGREDWLENPEGAKRFIHALIEGRKRLMDDPERGARIMGNALAMEPALARKIIGRTYYPSAQELMERDHPLSFTDEALANGEGIAKALGDIATFLHGKGRVPEVPDMGAKIDNTALKAVAGQ